MLNKRNLFVFYNPAAGGHYKNDLLQVIGKWKTENNWNVTVHKTKKHENFTDVLKTENLQDFDFIAAAGGDGTVSLVMEAMHKLELTQPLLIIATGTGNLAAKNFNLPADPLKCLNLLLRNSEIGLVDLIRVNGSYRLLNAGVGFNSRLMRQTTRKAKDRFGILAYFMNVFEALRRTTQVNFKLTIDDKSETILGADVFVANAGLGINMKPIKELLNPSDGIVSVFVTRPASFSSLLDILRKVFKGEKRGVDVISRYEFEYHLEVVPDKVLLVQSDGDILGISPMIIDLIPSAIQIVIPTAETAFPGFESINKYFENLLTPTA